MAQAQAKDPHIGPVEDRLSLISTREEEGAAEGGGLENMLKMLRHADRREQKMNERQKLNCQLARAKDQYTQAVMSNGS